MTKKDYIALAKIIAAFREKADGNMVAGQIDDCITRDLVVPLAHMLKQDNSAFDHARFLRACNVEGVI